VILTAQQIEAAHLAREIVIDPFDQKQVQAATYDLRVGPQGATTSTKKLVNIEEQGYLPIEPGDFAVVAVLEELTLGPQYAGRIGLRSKYARKGLVATTGPQIDPGYHGRLMVGLTNLTPNPISLPYKDDFISVEFHRLEQPTTKPYAGPYQDRLEFGPEEMEAVTEGKGMALSEVLTTLSSLNSSVGKIATSVDKLGSEVNTLRWIIPVIVLAGIAIMGIIVALK
jgi:dCTP deaminase